jgi:hypothetical protein
MMTITIIRNAENVTACEYKNLKSNPRAFLVTVNVVVSNFHICVPHSPKISVKITLTQFERSNMFH